MSSSSDLDYYKIGTMQAGDVLSITASGSPSSRGTQADAIVVLSTVGTRLRSMLFLMAIAHSASLICWAMDGSGRRAGSSHFLASGNFHFIPATRPISSTANTM